MIRDPRPQRCTEQARRDDVRGGFAVRSNVFVAQQHRAHAAQRAAEESLPFRDAFAVLFFVSVGMLFNPLVIVNEAGDIIWQARLDLARFR